MSNTLLKFNDYEFGEIITSWERRQNIVLDSAEIPRREGQVIQGSKQGIREYSLKGYFAGATKDIVRDQYDEMIGAITGVTGDLYLLDDRFAKCRLISYMDSFAEGSALEVLDFELVFQSELPYEVSATLTSTQYTCGGGVDETFVVTNNGNWPAYTQIEVQAPSGGPITADCTIENLANNDEFSYLGTVPANASLIINGLVVPFTVKNDGSSDIANYSGNVIKLQPGANTIQVNSILGAIITVKHRDTYV